MSTTWTLGQRTAKAVCTTGSESAPANPVKASQTVAFSTAVAGNTVTVRGLTFTAIANGSTPATPTEFSVGASNTACGDNFAAAIAKNAGWLAMTAANVTGTVTLTAGEYGTGPNAWTLTKNGAPITLGGATFAGGVDIVGASVRDVSQVEVFIEAASGQTVVNGNLLCYKLNPASMLWARVPGADLAIGASALRCIGIIVSAALYGQGWVAYLPSGVTISSGSANVWVNSVAKEDGSAATRALT